MQGPLNDPLLSQFYAVRTLLVTPFRPIVQT
jgi:hypothetical protein